MLELTFVLIYETIMIGKDNQHDPPKNHAAAQRKKLF